MLQVVHRIRQGLQRRLRSGVSLVNTNREHGGDVMRLSVRALAIASALVWGSCLFLVGVLNLVAPSYGVEFLRSLSSVYPGFHASHTFASVIIGAIYGLVDGFVGGSLFGWLYNRLAGSRLESGNTRLNKAA